MMKYSEGETQSAIKILQVGYNRALRHAPNSTVRVVRWLAGIHPGMVSEPFKLYSLDPNQIKRVCGPPRLYGLRLGGKWDTECPPIETIGSIRPIEEYFLHNNSEPLRELYIEHLDQQRTAWGHTDAGNFDDRISELNHLYDSMNEYGYLSQRELRDRGEEPERHKNDPVPLKLNEVTVNLSRSGAPLYAGFGAHRLAIAKVLDIDNIPVIVATRHREHNKRTPFPRYDGTN